MDDVVEVGENELLEGFLGGGLGGGFADGKRWVSVTGMGRMEGLRGRTTCHSGVFYTGRGVPIRRVYILAWSSLACHKLGPRKQLENGIRSGLFRALKDVRQFGGWSVDIWDMGRGGRKA